MTNKFNITITATDRATQVVNKVNKQIGSIFRPYENAKRSLKGFSDALGRNDLVKRPLWALTTIGKGVTMFGGAFGVAENSVIGGSARIASALGMIGGPVGGFLAGAAALIGGTAAVGVSMGQLGMDISRTAKGLNIGTRELQEYRGAAKLAGLETGAMDNSLMSLGQTLQDAQAGRNLQVATLMGQMGISVKRTKDGAIDTLAALRDVADVVSHIKDQNMARKLTDMLGVTELLPLLREGGQGLDEYLAKARKVGIQTDEQIQKNVKQAQAWNETKTAIDAAGVSVGNLIAQYAHLDVVASATSRTAEALSKTLNQKQQDEKAGGHSWWDRVTDGIPRYMDPFGVSKMLPYAGTFLRNYGGGATAPEAPRSASGAVGGAPAAAAPTVSNGSPIGLRNNNPGNLRSWPGAGAANGFATFTSPEAGLSAMGKNLMAYQDKHGINTLGGIVNRWAPAGDGNNVPAYLADLQRQTGFGADQKLDLHDPKVLAPLISAITKHENGQNPYTPEMIAQAVASALKDNQGGGGERPITVVVQNVPHGMTVKPVRGLGQATVGLTMQPGGMS